MVQRSLEITTFRILNRSKWGPNWKDVGIPRPGGSEAPVNKTVPFNYCPPPYFISIPSLHFDPCWPSNHPTWVSSLKRIFWKKMKNFRKSASRQLKSGYTLSSCSTQRRPCRRSVWPDGHITWSIVGLTQLWKFRQWHQTFAKIGSKFFPNTKLTISKFAKRRYQLAKLTKISPNLVTLSPRRRWRTCQ